MGTIAVYPRLRMGQIPPADRARSSAAWLEALRGDGPARDQAITDLYALLLRAARFELGRRRAALGYVRGEELEDIATQAADDALLAVLAKFEQYRGASLFTTWAYKFALLEAGVRLRRRARPAGPSRRLPGLSRRARRAARAGGARTARDQVRNAGAPSRMP